MIKIKIHSFVDLITNSSTETFVCATGKTREMVMELLNEFLIEGNGKAEELFDVYFETERYDDDGNEIMARLENRSDHGEGDRELFLCVDAKEPAHPKTIKVAETLTKLLASFDSDEYYC